MAAEPKEISRDEAQKLVAAGAQLIDVRTDHEWDAGRIDGATHIPLPDLSARAAELDRDRPVVVYCRSGVRSLMAAEALGAGGYDATSVAEGLVGWTEAGLPVVPEGGYVAESGNAAAVLEQRKRGAQSGS